MKHIEVKSFGPIRKANIDFGDLTIFVGPQASGKSILLQLIKLLIDRDHIHRTIEQYGYVWGSNIRTILERFFGEGMGGIYNDNSTFCIDKSSISLNELLYNISPQGDETLFYIPAQRVVCLQNGWPRFFNDYEDSVPYVLRHFSETLRQFLESNLSTGNGTIFPQTGRLRETLLNSFNNSIFHDGKITLDRTVKKRFKLNIGNSSIPYMAWSAGQKEFMPLLLGFYWLCPPDSLRKDSIQYVVIEEPEMGLHPQAIESVILQMTDLLSRGYKVIVSTHSPVLLEFAWAFQFLKIADSGSGTLAELFNIKEDNKNFFKNLLNSKNVKTYYFNRNDSLVDIKDISSLDAGSEDVSTAEWGGLSSFSSRASDIISKIIAQK